MTHGQLIPGVIVEESLTLTLEEFCQATQAEQKIIIAMVEYQLIQPQGKEQENWRFDSNALKRGRIAASFYHDLEVNMAGVALALDLLDQIEQLQHQVDILKKIIDQ